MCVSQDLIIQWSITFDSLICFTMQHSGSVRHFITLYVGIVLLMVKWQMKANLKWNQFVWPMLVSTQTSQISLALMLVYDGSIKLNHTVYTLIIRVRGCIWVLLNSFKWQLLRGAVILVRLSVFALCNTWGSCKHCKHSCPVHSRWGRILSKCCVLVRSYLHYVHFGALQSTDRTAIKIRDLNLPTSSTNTDQPVSSTIDTCILMAREKGGAWLGLLMNKGV